MGLRVLRMADGLVTLVDEVNLKGASCNYENPAEEQVVNK